jgi:hypothetical protein
MAPPMVLLLGIPTCPRDGGKAGLSKVSRAWEWMKRRGGWEGVVDMRRSKEG